MTTKEAEKTATVEPKQTSTKKGDAEKGPQFAVQRIYIKEESYLSKETPSTFQAAWKPEVNMDLGVSNSKLENDRHEVVLRVKITAKVEEKEAYVASIHQAGEFVLTSFDDVKLASLLGSFCPNMLYPYAREALSSLVTRGGFPVLYLSPINFDVLYQQQLEQQKKAAEEAKDKH